MVFERSRQDFITMLGILTGFTPTTLNTVATSLVAGVVGDAGDE